MIERTLHLLQQAAPNSHRAIVGLDGYVDEIIRVVDRQDAEDDVRFIPNLGRLADRIAKAAGKSAALELRVQQTKLGGNGPIMANALAAFGVPLTCIGALGSENAIHPAFQPMSSHCDLIPLAEPATTEALEFDDGKLMLERSESLEAITYERLLEVIGHDGLLGLFEAADFVAMNNWVSLFSM
ncbi:MAG: hypothetical protein ACI8W8_002850, partial [Rhodothermales bacterium]